MNRLFALMAVTALLSGCGSMQAQQRLNSLDDSLNAYRLLLRWGHYDQALAYNQPPPGEEAPPEIDPEKLKSIHLASYDVIDKVVSPDEKEAAITVAMSYYHEESNVLHTLKQVQHWWYSEDQRRWFLEDSLPDFIAGMRNRN